MVALQLNISEVYQDLLEVFSKTHATCLSPHRPWDCAIYPLLVAETQAMKDYIQEVLQQGFIRTATYSAGFFVAKKD
jgi:hypothetical protein